MFTLGTLFPDISYSDVVAQKAFAFIKKTIFTKVFYPSYYLRAVNSRGNILKTQTFYSVNFGPL